LCPELRLKEIAMEMLYNSENYAVVQFESMADVQSDSPARGGYEIVDKFARKEIYIEGAMAESFKLGVQALIDTSPSEEEMDDYLGRYASLMQHPLVLH
jgi:hypothetical protein